MGVESEVFAQPCTKWRGSSTRSFEISHQYIHSYTIFGNFPKRWFGADPNAKVFQLWTNCGPMTRSCPKRSVFGQVPRTARIPIFLPTPGRGPENGKKTVRPTRYKWGSSRKFSRSHVRSGAFRQRDRSRFHTSIFTAIPYVDRFGVNK